jgi:putative chitinase
MITGDQFRHLFPNAQDPDGWADAMNNVFPTYDINTPQRVAAFLAQCGHESGG